MTEPLILPLDTPDAPLAVAGGKGANLTRLVQAEFPVPPGFIVTTHAYRAFVAAGDLAPVIDAVLGDTSPDDPASLQRASDAIRQRFRDAPLPEAIAAALLDAYRTLRAATDDPTPVAVRSSATAEDLPDMSFAGQQDTFLNVATEGALLQSVVECWSSLWTARAIGYRARNGIPHQTVALAVVVQQMVPSEASGVLFTANPLSGRRTETVIDATLGLGEALVAGQVEPDHYVVDSRSGRLLHKTLGAKALAIRGQIGGGTVTTRELAADRQALPDEAIVRLAHLGQRVAATFGSPQDIEWGWADGELYLLQSRPITSLYPLPHDLPTDPLRVLLSFGAVQGMLDPITPLGQDTIIGLLTLGAGEWFGVHTTIRTQRVLWRAGERLWADLTPILRLRLPRRLLQRGAPGAEPALAQAMTLLEDDPRLAPTGTLPSAGALWRIARRLGPMLSRVAASLLWPDFNRGRAHHWMEALVSGFRARQIQARTLPQRLALFEAVLDCAFPVALGRVMPRVLAGMIPLALLHRLAGEHPDAPSALEVTRGLPHNVTTEMDLALWETAVAIRQDPAARARFDGADAATLADAFLAETLPPVAQQAITRFLDRYGARGLAEIDMGRPRWRENPTLVMQTLKSYGQIENPAQAPDAVFARGAAAAERAVDELAEAVGQTAWGEFKAQLVRWAAKRVRALSGLRESPKWMIVRLLGIVRESLLDSGRDLVAAGVLAQPDDLFFLYRDELYDLAAGAPRDWRSLVAARRARYAREMQRRPIPRLLLSDGQAFYEGVTREAAGEDSVVGLPVSPGVAEGPVRVVFDPHGVHLDPGDVLVCPGTDPAWTPLFLAAGALVMEVGGLMTHGSVVAREYGIPAVVGVNRATERLQTGQRVRVDGSAGRVILLDDAPTSS